MHSVCHCYNCVRNIWFVLRLKDFILALCYQMTEEEVIFPSPILNNRRFFTCKNSKNSLSLGCKLSSASEELDVWVDIKCFIILFPLTIMMRNREPPRLERNAIAYNRKIFHIQITCFFSLYQNWWIIIKSFAKNRSF